MMKLTTSFVTEINSQQVIAWRVGTKRRGFIYVDNLVGEDIYVAAELIALQYLLFKQKIFDREPVTGKGYELHVSSNKIRQIAKGKSSFKHLATHSYFIKTIMEGVTVKLTDSSDEFLPEMDDSDVSIEHIDSAERIEFGIVDTPAMGRIKITKHAIDQFDDQHHSGDLNKPVQSLIRRINHDSIQKKSLPESVVKHKLRKYGTVENLEVWSHDSSQLHYVIVRDHLSNIGTLVTIYKRHPAYE